jgi:hypothetical protein
MTSSEHTAVIAFSFAISLFGAWTNTPLIWLLLITVLFAVSFVVWREWER